MLNRWAARGFFFFLVVGVHKCHHCLFEVVTWFISRVATLGRAQKAVQTCFFGSSPEKLDEQRCFSVGLPLLSGPSNFFFFGSIAMGVLSADAARGSRRLVDPLGRISKNSLAVRVSGA